MATPAPAERLDLLHGPVQVNAPFLVNDERVRTGLGEGFEKLVGVVDHEMHFEGQPRDGPQPLDDDRAEGQVGNEVAVHYVDVNSVGPPLLRLAHLLCQAGHIGREN